MSNGAKYLTEPSPSIDESVPVPTNILKQEFGKRLYKLMLSRGWSQSDLARNSGLGRDAISVYVRGRSFPDPRNLAKLADAFGVPEMELLPATQERAIESEIPALEMKMAHGEPGRVWLKVNRAVSLSAAQKIIEVLASDDNTPKR